MAEEATVVRGINWRETFPFTNIFRSFRVAIHPSKLILALVALVALVVGGVILDALWSPKSRAIYAPAGGTEVGAYQAAYKAGQAGDFEKERLDRRKAIEEQYADLLIAYDVYKPDQRDQALKAAQNASDFDRLKTAMEKKRDDALNAAQKAHDDAMKTGDAASNDAAKRDPARKQIDDNLISTRQVIYTDYNDNLSQARTIEGQGIFIQFFTYEIAQYNGIVNGVFTSRWTGGMHDNGPGVFGSLVNFFVIGPLWLIRVHTLFFVLYWIWFMIIWSIFGGAIARIAAVHVARDEKISIRQALRFSFHKFLSFIFAPIIPLLIVLVIGLVVLVGGLVGNIPGIGAPLVGVFFFLALAAGFVMTLVLLGTAGGFNLMYPTIAAEGSDSFDAISRSFSYVYARPWRMLFYTMVALVYGAITYEFVYLFVQLMLALTHFFVGVGFRVDALNGQHAWDAMWPFLGARMAYLPNNAVLGTGQTVGAWCVAFWVYLVIGLIGAYVISLYFSANTIIYYLMRREVDATELDDVYLEQAEEDFGSPTDAPSPATADATPAGATATVSVTTVTVSTPTPDTGPAGGSNGPAETPPAST